MKTFYFYTHLNDDFNRRRVQALLNGQLILTDPKRFNDLTDAKIKFSKLSDDEVNQRIVREEGHEIAKTMSMDTKRSFVDVDRHSWAHSIHRIFCMSERWDLILMWAYYADSHKGICLQLEMENERIPIHRVRYSTHYPEIQEEQIKANDSEAWNQLLLTKSVDWMHEREWRLVTNKFTEMNGVDGVIDSPFKVSRVFLGRKFPEVDDLRLSVRLLHAQNPHRVDEFWDCLRDDEKTSKCIREEFFPNDKEDTAEEKIKKSGEVENMISRIRLLLNINAADISTSKVSLKQGLFELDCKNHKIITIKN